MKKYLLVLPLVAMTFMVVGCQKKNPTSSPINNKDKFVQVSNAVASSNESFAGYREVSSIYDGEIVVYSKTTDFTITRGDVVSTTVSSVVRELNDNITITNQDTYVETTTSYTTVGDVKTYDNGTTDPYTVPTYFMPFNLVESYFENIVYSGLGIDITLRADVKQADVYNFLLNKVSDNVSELSVILSIENGALIKYESEFIGNSGLPVKTIIDYNYSIA